MVREYGFDQEQFSSAKQLRRLGLDELSVLSSREYERIYSQQLPRPHQNPEELFADLQRCGYCYVKDVLTPKQLENLRTRTREQAAGEVAAGIAFREGGTQYGPGRKGSANQRIWSLLNKGVVYQQVATGDPVAVDGGGTVFQLLTQSLGRGFLISSAGANIAGQGGSAMYLHQDQGYVPMPYPPFPLVMQVIYLLDDFSLDNGGTLLVPGSHKALTTPRQFQQAAEEGSGFEPVAVAAEAPAGSALIFDGRLLHGTGKNITPFLRTGVLMYYCRGYMRQQENVHLSLSPEARKKASVELLQLAGFRPWRTLGQVEGSGAFANNGFVERPQEFVGQLTADSAKEAEAGELRHSHSPASRPGLKVAFEKNPAKL